MDTNIDRIIGRKYISVVSPRHNRLIKIHIGLPTAVIQAPTRAVIQAPTKAVIQIFFLFRLVLIDAIMSFKMAGLIG